VRHVEAFAHECAQRVARGRHVEERGLQRHVGDEVARERQRTKHLRNLHRHHAHPVGDRRAGRRPLEREQRHLMGSGQHPQLVPRADPVAAERRERMAGGHEQDAHAPKSSVSPV
jgi:hypothetical protein